MFGFHEIQNTEKPPLKKHKNRPAFINFEYIHCLSHSLFCGVKINFKVLFPTFDLRHHIKIREMSILYCFHR